MRWSSRIVLAALFVLAAASAWAEPEYIGADKCGKMCHKVEYKSWQTLAHSKAFERLEPEQQTDEGCLSCHATGGRADLPGVQCESCHGPGSDYKGLKTMKDREVATAAGLILPDESTCKRCHENAPHEVPAFDFETALAKGKHEVKQKAKAAGSAE